MGFLDAALKACEEIFTTLQNGCSADHFEKLEIGAGGDRSTGADLLAESIFVRHLSPFGKIISEESGEIGEGECTIWLDPIDGSDNFLSHFPYYGASIALCEGEKTLCGVVANFANGDLFYKSEAGFFKQNMHDSTPTSTLILPNPHATIGIFERAYSSPKMVELLRNHKIKFRSPGAIALSLAYAHEVRFVLFGGNSREYDVRAGLYFCEGLWQLQSEGWFLISKDSGIFDKMASIFRPGDGT